MDWRCQGPAAPSSSDQLPAAWKAAGCDREGVGLPRGWHGTCVRLASLEAVVERLALLGFVRGSHNGRGLPGLGVGGGLRGACAWDAD